MSKEDIKQPFLNQEIEFSPQKPPVEIDIDPHHVDRNLLKSLFLPDNIRDGVSNKIITKLKGMNTLVSKLKTDILKGISIKNAEETRERIANFGRNTPVIKPLKSLWFFIKEAFEDTMLRILSIAAIISLVVGILQEGVETGWMEGVAIIFAVFIVVSVSSVNNYMKEKQFAKLNAEEEMREVPVTRDSQRQMICIYDLLVGDILHLATGDIIPVDGVLVMGNKITMDESSVTGETDLIVKTDFVKLNDDFTSERAKKEMPYMISGAKVMEGTGNLMVCAVGSDTQIGQLKLRLQEENPPTPLQLKLETVADQIGKIGLATALLTVFVMIIHLLVEICRGDRVFADLENLKELVDFLLIGITIIVVAVPEGLPLAVTIALAYSVGKMKEENNFVKHLSSCEIMGGANNICTDKTGTLTQNKMTVMSLFIEEQNFQGGMINKELISKENLDVFLESVCVNSDANPKKSNGVFEHLGNKTECSLLELAMKMGYDYNKYRPHEKLVRIIPFSSKTKRMTTVYKINDHKYRIYSKGASEIMLELCNDMQTPNNSRVLLTEQSKANIRDKIIEDYAKKALRTITIAYKEVETSSINALECQEECLESNLTLIAIAGVMDPLRPEIKEAIRKCKNAEIIVRMVTGDNLSTAVAIAKEANIISHDCDEQLLYSEDHYFVLEGKKFRELVGGLVYEKEDGIDVAKVKNLEMFKKIEKDLRVLARSTPDDKYILVTGLKQLQNVVAVTGDGTNDAPALKKADVGFAMGITGTLVARQAAGIILLDDNFKSIVTACKWGRNIYDSIRKFIQFQLTINIVALFMAFIGGAVIKESPLNAIQMLWVNLIMDTFASLALATEPPNESLLDRPPYGRNESIVTPNMWRNIFGQGVFQIIVLSIILFKGPEIFGVVSSMNMGVWNVEKGVHYTIFFQTFVFMQVFNEINCRKLKRNEFNVFKGFFNNWLFLVIEFFTIVVQVFIVQFGDGFIKTSPLSAEQHAICLAIGAFSLLTGILVKLIPEGVFNRIKLLKEVEVKGRNLDRSVTSMLKRKASSRLKSMH